MTMTPTKPDDAIVRALIGDTDIYDRTIALVYEVTKLQLETDELRLRAHGLLNECGAFEAEATVRVRSLISTCGLNDFATTDDVTTGVCELVSALTGGGRLHDALHELSDKFKVVAEGSAQRPEAAE
jgi:hypothetical protein